MLFRFARFGYFYFMGPPILTYYLLNAASSREKHDVPSRGVAACIGFAVQDKPTQFESAGASALHTPSLLVLIQVTRRDERDRSFIDRGVLITLPLGQCCRSVGA